MDSQYTREYDHQFLPLKGFLNPMGVLNLPRSGSGGSSSSSSAQFSPSDSIMTRSLSSTSDIQEGRVWQLLRWVPCRLLLPELPDLSSPSSPALSMRSGTWSRLMLATSMLTLFLFPLSAMGVLLLVTMSELRCCRKKPLMTEQEGSSPADRCMMQSKACWKAMGMSLKRLSLFLILSCLIFSRRLSLETLRLDQGSRWQQRQAMLQNSDSRSSFLLCDSIWCAWMLAQRGVPMNPRMHTFWDWLVASRAKPKSTRYSLPPLPRMMLWGLMSWCRTPASCTPDSTLSSSRVMLVISAMEQVFFLLRSWLSISISRKLPSRHSPELCMRGTPFLPCTRPSISISFLRARRVLVRLQVSILRATAYLLLTGRTLSTLPKQPSPSRSSISQC